jgi:hypothetical protein
MPKHADVLHQHDRHEPADRAHGAAAQHLLPDRLIADEPCFDLPSMLWQSTAAEAMDAATVRGGC